MGCSSSKNWELYNDIEKINMENILTDIKGTIDKNADADIFFKIYDPSKFEKSDDLRFSYTDMNYYTAERYMKTIHRHGTGKYKSLKKMILLLIYYEPSKLTISIYTPSNSKIKASNILTQLTNGFKVDYTAQSFRNINGKIMMFYEVQRNLVKMPFDEFNDMVSKNYENMVNNMLK
jgi:hypothetical protein